MTARPFHQATAPDLRCMRRLIRDAALVLVLSASFLAPSVTAADACRLGGGMEARAGLSPTQRSIVLLEGRDPANVPAADVADGLVAHAGLLPAQRSIVLLEGQDPANYPAVATTGVLEARAGLSPVQRSIVLLEGQDPGNFPTPAVC